MTVWRQDWNGAATGPLLVAALVAAWVGAGGWSERALAQATTERVVINRVSGYAISGFDPVAYFTSGTALSGQNRYEFVYDGAIWRFQNEGNLSAFRHNPEVYEPLFGGYDPVTIASGKAVDGLPQLWAIVGERLVLFSSAENRELLLANPRGVMLEASHRWPELRNGLAR
jgi:YHS domain-containing protein